MIWPKHVPVFTSDDIISPPPKEYELGKRKSFVGWLKYLFLYYECDKDCIQIRPEDRKDYNKALDIARKTCKISNVHEYEEKATCKSQAASLNKICKKLGYTEKI